MTKVDPQFKDQYLTKAYNFDSEEELKHYEATASTLTLDDLYDMIKKIVRKYIDSDDFHISIITVLRSTTEARF